MFQQYASVSEVHCAQHLLKSFVFSAHFDFLLPPEKETAFLISCLSVVRF